MESIACVHVSTERLRELEELERKLPCLIDKAINLYELHEYDKENISPVNVSLPTEAETYESSETVATESICLLRVICPAKLKEAVDHVISREKIHVNTPHQTYSQQMS